MQRHVLAHDPAQDDQERRHEQRDLQTAADGNVDGKVHFAFESDHDSSHVLGSVSNNGDEDEADEGSADVGTLNNGVNAIDEVIGAEGDEDSNDNEGDHSWDRREGVAFLGSILLLGLLALRLSIGEEFMMGKKLEDNVKNIEEEKDHSSATRQKLDVRVIVFDSSIFAVLRDSCVKGSRDD